MELNRPRQRPRPGWLLAAFCGWASLALAQTGGEIEVSEGAVPVSRVIADPGVPYQNVIRNQRIFGNSKAPKVGDGGTLRFGLPGTGLSSGSSFPFVYRGFAPADASLKLGRFYLDLGGPVSLSFLWTDNQNRSATTRESGLISVARFNIRALIQWSEGLQFSTRGALIWLPFQNEAGLDGFGIFDPINARLSAAGGRIPLNAQFTYDFTLSKWDMQFIDSFSADFVDGFFGLRGEFADEIVILDPLAFNSQDRAGRYRYGGTGGAATSRAGRGTQFNTQQQLDTQSLVLRNLVGLSASRVVPTNTRITLVGSHEDQWFVSDNNALPAKVDTARVIAVNQRENMRFKPFVSGSIRRTSVRPGIDKQASGGFFGPITDQLDFLGSAGWQKAATSDQNNLIWQVTLNHDAGPLTTQTLTFSRQQSSGTSSNNDLITRLTYRITQVLGPNLNAQLFGNWTTFDDLDNKILNTSRWAVGARMLYQYSPKTDFNLQLVRTQILQEDPAVGDSTFITARASAGHRYSETVTARLVYIYENRDGGVVGNSYSENRVIFTIEKQFR